MGSARATGIVEKAVASRNRSIGPINEYIRLTANPNANAKQYQEIERSVVNLRHLKKRI